MAALIWNEGMSVGIEAIDNGHKQIITIIAKLTAAESGDLSRHDIKKVFTELQLYVGQHFVMEEALLEKVSYSNLAEHKLSHQSFMHQFSQLQKQWLNEAYLISPDNIILFLHQWVIEHILKEDIDYVHVIQSYNNRKNRSEEACSKFALIFNNRSRRVFKKLSTLFSNRVNLTHRVFITTFVPAVVLFIFYFVILFDNYRDYKSIDLVIEINNVIKHVDDISHSLQVERVLSSHITNSNYLSQQLVKQRLITDQTIVVFQQFLRTGLEPSVQRRLQSYVESLPNNFNHLKEYREKIDKKTEDFEQIFQAYTLLIEQLLLVSEHLIHFDMESRFVNNISAINSVLLSREYMEQLRALGVNDLNNTINEDITSQQVISLVTGKQLNTLRVFHYFASNEQKKLCKSYCNALSALQVLNQYLAQVKQLNLTDKSGKAWFDLMSIEVEQLKELTDKLIVHFSEKVQVKSDQLAQNFYITLGILTILLFAATAFSLLLNHTIINPIRRVTFALNDMAKGLLHVHFNTRVANDEIGAMQMAVEKLRQNLSQMNVFQATLDRQKSEIAYRKSQQEHYESLATKDALTGAVNRHQFDLVLADEINKTSLHHQALSILILDIDHFKQVNDNFGHGVGDEVLIMFYRACKAAVRNTDVVARIGGEEFVIILPRANAQNAFQFAECLREKIQQLEIIVDDNVIELTVSIGGSQWKSSHFTSAKEFIDDADKLLYQAKKQGRNKVVVR
ncbi:MAG: bacteriohemerythrin [Litorilituus sp.]|nr:bacteriohemerythrin [Litorilituus sp.]